MIDGRQYKKIANTKITKIIFFFEALIPLFLLNSVPKIIPLKRKNKITNKTYDFVGPICETTDKFLSTNKFQKLNEKDYIIICDVGAYGTSLSSNYNIRPKPAEILIKGSRINVIKKRQKLKDLI